MAELADLLDVLQLEPTGEGAFAARSVDLTGGAVVFGGQLLAQSIVAGASIDPAKVVKSVHTVFARGASLEAQLHVEVDVMSSGRAFGSAAVTIRQGGTVCTRSLVLLTSVDPDLIRHQSEAPSVGAPADATPSSHGAGFWEIRTVGGVDISDPDAVGPAELRVWTRFPDAPADPVINQALLAFSTDGFLIGTAMRPHAGVGQSMAHVSISTSVITHTLTFHEPVDASSWMLLDQSSPYAGNGRGYGRADVYDEGGALIASFTQDNMIRDFPAGTAPAAGQRAAH